MARKFFSRDDQQRITQAIFEAEKNTSGEIQVHLENTCKKPVLKRALEIFKTLNMHKTAQRNGVLIYLAIEDHKFAIIGDAGINEKVPHDFWDSTKEHMEKLFREGRFTDGLVDGIRMAGEQLGTHFPYSKDDKNELPDEISFGND
ncbi:MAG TPA: TPM domain-containing protein [Cyclobacteriaceae bacterium]|nr:TPM domain-containing protein [Cyclobacteriaceae bacterium]